MELLIPSKHAQVLLAEGVRHKALYGGRGSGKTTSIALYLIGRALERPRLIVCARQFQNSIRDSASRRLSGGFKASAFPVSLRAPSAASRAPTARRLFSWGLSGTWILYALLKTSPFSGRVKRGI